MSDTTPVLTEKCPYGGYSCGERGFLCDECKEDRADARWAAALLLRDPYYGAPIFKGESETMQEFNDRAKREIDEFVQKPFKALRLARAAERKG